MHDIVLALPLGETVDGNVLLLGEAVDVADEGLAHLGNILGGGETTTFVETNEPRYSGRVAELGHVAVQVHAVDAFEFVGDVFGLEFGDGVRHAGSGVRFGLLLYSLPLDGSISGFFLGSGRAAGPDAFQTTPRHGDTPSAPFN